MSSTPIAPIPAPLDEVVGRDKEAALVVRFLDTCAAGPAALLLEGEAGIGKTTLWKAGIAEALARRYQVLACRPPESEAVLSFSALGDLLTGVIEATLPALPPPQRRALEVALLLEEMDEAPLDPRAVGLGVLNAIRVVAAAGPVLVAVDDVQWVDGPTASVLEFAARRLRDERVGFMLTQRRDAGERPPLGLERALPTDRFRPLRLGPLSLGALHHLLRGRLGRALPRPLLRQVHVTSGGNPFFALEIARALERDGVVGPDAELPLPRDFQKLVHDRVTALPPNVQSVLSIVAAVFAPTLELVEAAAGEASAPLLAAAVEADVLELEHGRIRFTHPLLAQAAYAALGPGERRKLHRRLAGTVSDAEERARHLALAAERPDPRLAEVLDDAARQAGLRGAPASAAELAEQARTLTPAEHVQDRLRRTLEAAYYYHEAGHSARTRALCEEAAGASAPGPLRAEALALLAAVSGNDIVGRDLTRQALTEAGADLRVRAKLERELAIALFNLREDIPAAAEHAKAAAGIAAAADDRVQEADALGTSGLIEAILGEPTAASTLRRAVRLQPAAAGPHDPPPARLVSAVAGIWFDDFAGARADLSAARAWAEDLGQDYALPALLSHLSGAEWLDGDVAAAAQSAAEAYEVALLVDWKRWEAIGLAHVALLDAHLGRIASARARAAEALALSREAGAYIGESTALSALALLELSLGAPAAAHAHLTQIVARTRAAGIGEPGAMRFVPDDIEALIALGRDGEAEDLLRWFEERATRLDRASALARCHRCRALLAASVGDLAAGFERFERALAEHERMRLPLEHARTLLALGATQRRAKRKRAARESLVRALAIFEELDAPLWAERARSELGRIGGHPPPSDELSPAERRVAELVAEGLTNRDVAAALFVSEHTVESHLRNVYRKLGVRSRTQLARRVWKPERATQTSASNESGTASV